MFQITKKQISKRWDDLSINLREILCSPENGKIIWNVCGDNHLSDEKIKKIAGICGLVIMGLVHPDDLAKEIKETLALNPIIIDSIVKEVNNKIFAPIRSEINKALTLPMPTEEEIEAEEKSLQVEKLKSLEEESPIVSDVFRGGVKYIKPEGVEAEPIKIIGIGKGEKIIIPGAEGDNLKADKLKSLESEGPVIIHKEEEFKSVAGSKKSLGELFGFLGGSSVDKKMKKEAPVAAKIEIGGDKKDILSEENDKLKEILESKPEVNFPLDLLHIKQPIIIKSTENENVLLPQGVVEVPIIMESIENKEEILKSPIEEKTIEEKEKPRIVHYSDLKTPLPEIKSPITYDLRSATNDQRPMTNDLRPMNNDKPIIEPIKEIPKEKVKVVDFTAEVIIPKKIGIIQDVAPKTEIAIGNIDIPKPPIIEKTQDKIEQSSIKQENQKNNQEEPKKKKGFFGFLFKKKEVIANNADIKIGEKSVAEKENKKATNINTDEQVIKLIK